jgi:hypothetical protein
MSKKEPAAVLDCGRLLRMGHFLGGCDVATIIWNAAPIIQY